MKKQPRLRERKKALTREAILDAATRLFLEKGYERTTVEEIADAAMVARRTFFRYFATKESAVWPDQEARIARFEAMLAQARTTLEPFDAVVSACLEMAQEFQLHRAALVVQQRIIRSSHTLIARQSEFDSRWALSIRTTLLDVPPHGDVDAARLARTFAGAVMGVVRASYDAWVSEEPARDLVAEGRVALSWLQVAWTAARASSPLPDEI